MLNAYCFICLVKDTHLKFNEYLLICQNIFEIHAIHNIILGHAPKNFGVSSLLSRHIFVYNVWTIS